MLLIFLFILMTILYSSRLAMAVQILAQKNWRVKRYWGSGDEAPGKFKKPRPLDLRETPFLIIEIGPF